MAPRASNPAPESAEPPRRSSRISAQPKNDIADTKESVKKTAPKSKKRSVDTAQSEGENPTAKKVCLVVYSVK